MDHPSGQVPNRRPVAIFIPSLAGGGAERAILEIARRLTRHNFTIDLLVARRDGAFSDLVPEQVRLINMQSWKTLTCLPKLIRYIRHEQPTVLISSLDMGNLTALLAKVLFVKNLCLIIRQENHYTESYKLFSFVLRCLSRLMRWLLPAADAIVAVSHGVAQDLQCVAPRTSGLVQVIPNPVVTPMLFDKAKLPVGHPWFGDSRIPVILTAGRLLIRQKDQPTLFKAFAEVLKFRAGRLILLGEGPDRFKLIALARQLGIYESIDFVGFQPNPFAYMRKARAFVLSSIYEGLPTVLIEAMACGTPVVSTDCPAGPREILEDGKWGYLVPVGDWQGLAHAILATLDRPIPSEMLIARSKHYSEHQSTDQHSALLRRVIR